MTASSDVRAPQLVWLREGTEGFLVAGDQSGRAITAQFLEPSSVVKGLPIDTSLSALISRIASAAPVGASGFTLGRRRGRPSKGGNVDLAVKFYRVSDHDTARAATTQSMEGVAETLRQHLISLRQSPAQSSLH